MREILVFAYGSLMWRPGFPYAESYRAWAPGWARSFCILTEHHRGSPGRPGLVFGMRESEGGACEGMAFSVCCEDWQKVSEYLDDRELREPAYFRTEIEIVLDGHPCSRAVCYVADSRHPSVVRPSPAEAAEIILGASGCSGRNIDYLKETYVKLAEMGIEDADMGRIIDAAESIESSQSLRDCSPLPGSSMHVEPEWEEESGLLHPW